ncbi:MAG: HAD-IA family hydrolase [Rhizobiaceae bacterium]
MRLVLFDVDGTLIDSAALIHACLAETFREAGYADPGLDGTRSVIGLTLDRAIARLLGREIDEEIQSLTARYKDLWLYFASKRELKAKFYPGMLELVRELGQRDDLLLGMVTGKSRRGVRFLIDEHGLEKTFMTWRTADDCPSKPHPAMVMECCAEAGIVPARTLVIGDTSYDMQMASSAGALALGVGWGYHARDQLLEAGARAIAETADAIASLLEEMLPVAAQ